LGHVYQAEHFAIMNSLTFKILSYNTHLFGGTVVQFAPNQIFDDAQRRDQILSRVLSLKPDFVGFSEVWSNSYKEQIILSLKDILPFSAWDKNENPLELGAGLLFLSKYAIAPALGSSFFTRYTDLVGADAFSQKGFILARAEVNGQQIIISHTHAQSGDDSISNQARAKNLAQLAESLSSTSGPAFIIGDLNVIGEDIIGHPTDDYKLWSDTLAKAGFSDAYRKLFTSPSLFPGYTYDGTKNLLIKQFAPDDAQKQLRQRIDYLFFRELVPHGVEMPDSFIFSNDGVITDLSDHYPLLSSVATVTA
jgi:endonuclease/exonuclease/phosphatase family metal-dependent hydrolase